MNTSPNTKQLKIERFADAETAAKEAGAYISDILAQYVDRPVLFLTAGGSSTSVLDHINVEYLSPDLTVTTTDDRFSTELDINNFSILHTTQFYNGLVQADAFCINSEPYEGEEIENYRARFEKNLREWKQDFPKGIIIALYGMGADGHTGGMIPGLLTKEAFDAEFNNADRIVGTFDAFAVDGGLKAGGYDFPQRISTTLPFMRDWVDHAVFYITGAAKKPMLDRVLAITDIVSEENAKTFEETDFSALPARVIPFMRDAVIFTDIK